MESGEKVIIRQNPHHAGAKDVIGTVVVFRPGEGFGGCDLVDLRYKNPADGNWYKMPFGLSCLASADEFSLIALAEHHEAIATELRTLAEGL